MSLAQSILDKFVKFRKDCDRFVSHEGPSAGFNVERLELEKVRLRSPNFFFLSSLLDITLLIFSGVVGSGP